MCFLCARFFCRFGNDLRDATYYRRVVIGGRGVIDDRDVKVGLSDIGSVLLAVQGLSYVNERFAFFSRERGSRAGFVSRCEDRGGAAKLGTCGLDCAFVIVWFMRFVLRVFRAVEVFRYYYRVLGCGSLCEGIVGVASIFLCFFYYRGVVFVGW